MVVEDDRVIFGIWGIGVVLIGIGCCLRVEVLKGFGCRCSGVWLVVVVERCLELFSSV